MKVFKIIYLLFLMSIAACVNDPSDDLEGGLEKYSDKKITIRSGTSFGMCFGYCLFEVTITSDSLTFISSSWMEEKYPTKNYVDPNTEVDWLSIINLINMDNFESLDDVIGCPDCADGGSEWIEIKIDNRVKKVTFEYGDSLEGTNELLTKLREIRSKYDAKNINQREVYFNSFEFDQDTVGWTGLRAFMLVDEPAPFSGKRSLYIGGGCIQPSASLEITNLIPEYYYVSFWAKAENSNFPGGVSIFNESNNEISETTISQLEWTFFDIGPISVKDNSPLKINLIIGGFIPANMFIDNLRVYSFQ